MHLCLLPPEILLHIFSIQINHRQLCSPATLAFLARTCRTLKEPALDILWKEITGFQPLIACLPEHVTTTDIKGRLTLKRPLLNEECRLIGRYTKRIRYFHVDTSDLNKIDDRIVQAFICAPSPIPLLPNLRSLWWRNDQERFFPLLHTLLGSTITCLNLAFNPKAPSFTKSALLASVGACCPSIRELHCEYCGDSEESADAICEALCGMRELFRLCIGVFNTQMLLRLASISSLKYLELNLRTYNINHTHSHSPPISPSQLEQVDIITPSFSVLTHCLKNIQFLSCRSVNLCIDDSGLLSYDPKNNPDLIISISQCFPPTLEKLNFDFYSEFDLMEDAILADPSFVLGFDTFAPMLSFGHLKYLNLDFFCTSAIDDSSLKTMAQSWPQLEHFSFGIEIRSLVPPSLTFIGLIHLIQHCPLLQSIEMPFRAHPVDVNSTPFSDTIPSEKMRALFVGISPIVDPCAVACQLNRLMPKLTRLHFYDRGLADLPPLLAQYEADWVRVNDYLRVFSRGYGTGIAP